MLEKIWCIITTDTAGQTFCHIIDPDCTAGAGGFIEYGMIVKQGGTCG